jgi:hypothetical protein
MVTGRYAATTSLVFKWEFTGTGAQTVYTRKSSWLQLSDTICYTGKPRYMRFRSMQVSVSTVTNIYTIPLYVPPKISNSAADYEIKNLYQRKKSRPKTVARKQCCQIVLLPRHYAAISSVSLRPPSKAEEISVIGKDLGFEDVDSPNIRECLDSHSQPLSDTDLTELQQQRTYDEK